LENPIRNAQNLGQYSPGIEAGLSDLVQHDTVQRIWQKDFTLWKPEPKEITNRLGWLTVTDLMSDQIPELQAFAREIVDSGFRQVILLGMGGSSLGPEVLRHIFGSARGYPDLIVLDSTMPERVLQVTEAIDPRKTLFLVSSKSGTTTEPLVLFQYFQNLTAAKLGNEKTRSNFVAITDPGTPLAKLAQTEGFRRTFLNPPDIGGRYSVLSYFGMVPAALIGIDISTLMNRAECMKEACASSVPVHDNPGAWLGASMGTFALQGRDKLTLITSPATSSYGLWVEQLIAESTGKEGKGIIPVAGEPPVKADQYGDDRLFIYLRLHGDDNFTTDAAIDQLKSSGHPVLTLEMQDRYDLGAEFFRWEFATPVAGAILGINPFDQPDVQRAKDATEHLLKGYTNSGKLPRIESEIPLNKLMENADKGKYLALMAYINQTAETEEILRNLRHRVVERYHIATTLGYGPRFLHSTGQLHKGGPDKVLCLQITTDHKKDIPIPDNPYTFGIVADAQAIGDLEALKSTGRPVARIHVSGDIIDEISKLVNKINQ
jgi:glucose-6-phosphate isomerase